MFLSIAVQARFCEGVFRHIPAEHWFGEAWRYPMGKGVGRCAKLHCEPSHRGLVSSPELARKTD